jgi:hypothetical protein
MIRSCVALTLMACASQALGCDTYTSTWKKPGERVLRDDNSTWTITITEHGTTKVYTKSAGTFSGDTVAWRIDTYSADEAYEIGFDEKGRFMLANEPFALYCKDPGAPSS